MSTSELDRATDRFADALVYAHLLHREQRRKGTTIPYVSHLLGVASLVLEHGGSEDEAIGGLLHDAMEDQGGEETGDEIKRRFGDAVYSIVKGCTDAVVVPKPPWRARKEEYIRHVANASASIKLVSAADKLYNARAILADYRVLGDELWARFTGGRDGTLWYYRALVQAFNSGVLAVRTKQLVDELDRAVAELERLAAT